MTNKQAIVSVLEDLYDNISHESFSDLVEVLVRVTKTDIDSALQDQAAIYAYMSMIYAKAQDDYDSTEVAIKQYEATEHLEFKRDQFRMGFKATGADIEAHIASTPKYISLHTGMKLSKYRLNLFRKLLTAMEHRKDMLVQLSSNRRAETKLN